MALAIISYIAGVLTVAAPCILPLLPVIIGGTLTTESQKDKNEYWYRPLIITSSLAVSVIIFTLLLKASTLLLNVPLSTWNIISGGIIIFFGLNLLFPAVWERFMAATGLQAKSNQLLGTAYKKRGIYRDALMGAALGPVFSSCSPTYALIVAAVLPESFARGMVYLISYALGLASVLLLVALAGQSAARKLGWLSNPHGVFKRVLGLLFLIVGISVLFGLDRDFQAYVLEQGWYGPVQRFEEGLNL